MPTALPILCTHCGQEIPLEYYDLECPHCGMSVESPELFPLDDDRPIDLESDDTYPIINDEWEESD